MPTKHPILEIKRKRPMSYRGLVIFRAKKNGCPFLIHEMKWWRGINGCLLQVGNVRIIFLFRRRVLRP